MKILNAKPSQTVESKALGDNLRHLRRGVTLVEILIALGIFIIGATVIVGMFNLAGRTHVASMDAADSSALLEEIRSELRAMALRGCTAPKSWATEPQRMNENDTLAYLVGIAPVGGYQAEKDAIKRSSPLLYAVRIEIFSAGEGPENGDVYETFVFVRYDYR